MPVKLFRHVSLRTLKRTFRFLRAAKKLFAGEGMRIFLRVAFVTGALLLIVMWSSYAINRYFDEQIAHTLTEGTTVARGSSENLLSVSFYDLFSGVGWVNQDRTNMHHDRTVTAFLFPPKFEWYRSRPLIGGRRASDDVVCVGARCLEARGGELFFDGEPLPLPRSVAEKALVQLSPNVVGSSWLLGVTARAEDGYEGYVFSWDGARYMNLFPGPAFRSDYEGVIGAGGTLDDFLVIYGAYEGRAWRVRGNTPPEDVSPYFTIRVMNQGFRPVAMHDGTSWYVWSGTEGNPKLIKLFEDRFGVIVGAVDLTAALFPPGTTAVSFSRRGHGVLRAELTIGEAREEWEFRDGGFDTSVSREVVSANLNGAPAAVRRATIAEVDALNSGAGIQFFLSNDGSTWMPAVVSEEVVFPDRNGIQLLWKAVFEPGAFVDAPTPFLNKVRVDYKIKLL